MITISDMQASRPGINDVQFQFANLMPASKVRVLLLYLENGRVVGAETNEPMPVSYEKNLAAGSTRIARCIANKINDTGKI